ncbi:LOW QUALITY PROTEIN: protein phosphatase 1 regulatory subunit 15B [Lates calcarifer]|uniref:LOW QUALITY PROTEIN: protein phosphatase 1 regulatory subunit 15B n=1 Tax=Lates calcarifer TaxID=8187 RepID=A0AAJ8DT28_LATCA|nr:LOW QUALITY PROTEIN: protein phosphatase 1 regulatory subunit 15B [Lates calcarifer]
MSDERHLSGGQSSSSPTGHGVTSTGLDAQESSWIGLLSVVSRPALSFLQKYLPGRPRNPTPAGNGAGWISEVMKTSSVDEEREFLRQLDDMMPLTQHASPHLTYLRWQHEGAAGLLEPEDGSALPWLTADSLREMGIENAEVELNLCQQTQVGYLSSARTFLSHVLLSSVSPPERNPPGGRDWVRSGGGKSRTWWGSLWGGEESSHRELLSWSEETDRLCPQQPGPGTKAPAVFVQSAGTGSTLGENTGPADHKEELANNGGLHTVQNTEGSKPDHGLSIRNHLSGSGAACSQVAPLTPDQDNGYSSLEEEQVQMSHLNEVKGQSADQQEAGPPRDPAPISAEMEEEEEESTSAQEDEEEQQNPGSEGQTEAVGATVIPTPQCQNKAIAFIMGCPCSDDDSSQSDGESSDDDDGFDSEGSSDLSDSSDEDDDDEASDSDGEVDLEAERLWSSLCQSVDPYNPRNFTAPLHTRITLPRSIPASTPPSSTHSTPASSPDLPPLPLSFPAASPPLPSLSPPSGHDVWDDSTSASEVDEAESLRLWSSFSSSDPYSPFNFQAPIGLKSLQRPLPGPGPGPRRPLQTPPHSPHHKAASPPEYRKEEAEERLDSGFSEASTSSSTSSTSQRSATTKKVRFCDNVEEFFASCGEEEEDRRGPWEELARDRCRFLRRCQEVEQSIAYCLQPQHRSLVYRRLTLLYVQD